MYAAYQVQPDPQGMLFIIQDIRAAIREGLYNDLFKMMALSNNTNMTATEVAERHEEKLLQLGPVLERLHAEGFIPLIDRTFYLMLEQDMIPPWPEEIQGMPLKVDFVSLLAQAQKMVATGAVDKFMGFIGNLGQMFPEMLDIPDVDVVGDAYADYLGLGVKMVRNQDDRDARRQTRAEQAQQIQGTEQMQQTAASAKTMAETPVRNGDASVLDELLAGVA